MKINKTSFLFFCLFTLNMINGFGVKFWAQNDTKYYRAINELTDIDSVGMAFEYFKLKTESALNTHNSIKAAYYLELRAYGKFKMGFPLESEVLGIQALQLLDKVKDTLKTQDARERLFNHLGMVYRGLKDVSNAQKYYNRALDLNTKLEDKATIISNIANLYADQADYPGAVEILAKYYNDVLQMSDTSSKATYIDNYGSYKSRLEADEGLRLMEAALKIRLELKDLIGIYDSYRHLCLFYMDIEDIKKARYYSHNLLDIANKINTPSYQLEALNLKIKLENNPDFHQYVTLNDIINSDSKQRENKFAAIKYNVEEKEKLLKENQHKLEVTELERKRQETQKLLYLSISVFGAILTVLVIFLLKSRHKKEKIQQVYLTEARISKKVHDEVANDVYHLMTKLQGHNYSDDEVIVDELENIYNKTRDISKENNTLDVSVHFDELIKDLLMGYRSEQVNVITKNLTKINWDIIPELNRMTLYRVLQELMTNMRKHSKASIVLIGFNQINNKTQIEYKDNGIGCELNIKGGLQNTENRIESINGTINFETSKNKGFKAIIAI